MDGTKASRWIMMAVFSLTFSGCQNTTKQPVPLQPVAVTEETADTKAESKKAALVNVELGIGYLSQGQMARAKTKLNHAMKLAPEITETHTAMAHFLEQVGQMKDAEKEHRKAIRYSSKSTVDGAGAGAVYNNYGAFLCRQGRMKEADQAFNSALEDKKYSRTAEVYENAGICALKGPTPEKGEAYLLKAIRHDPKRSTALLELSELKLNQNNLEVANNLLKQYKQVTDPTARSVWLGIRVSHALKDEDGVASQALMLKNIFENSPEYQQYLQSEIGNS